MKCISCEIDINPQWKHAIDMNVCPFCGKHIMEEHLKNLLTSLRENMESLQQYSAQLDDFLLSNYNYIKTDSPSLRNYLPKEAIKEMRREIDDAEFQEKKKSIVKIKALDENGEVVEQEVVVEKVQSDAKAAGFFDRAEALKTTDRDKKDAPKSVAEKTRDLKAMAERIKAEGALSTNEGGMASMISPDMLDQADPDAVAEFQSQIAGGDIVASGLPESATGDDDEIPSIVLSMASRAANKSSSQDKDLKTLHEMQNKVANAQKRLNSGKGGFSRT